MRNDEKLENHFSKVERGAKQNLFAIRRNEKYNETKKSKKKRYVAKCNVRRVEPNRKPQYKNWIFDGINRHETAQVSQPISQTPPNTTHIQTLAIVDMDG